MSKIIERVAASRFKSHISTHNFLQQSTYRSFHLTETAVYNDLIRATENGQVPSLVLLDLSAAFDTVDHEILVSFLSKRFSLADLCLIGVSPTSMTALRRSTMPIECLPVSPLTAACPKVQLLAVGV